DVDDVRALEASDHALARERLELGRVGLDDVDRVAARFRLVQRALHHLRAERAPQLDLHAGLLLECLRERNRLRGGEGGVNDERPLLARAFGEALRAVGAGVEVHRVLRRLRKGAGREADPQHECRQTHHPGDYIIPEPRSAYRNLACPTRKTRPTGTSPPAASVPASGNSRNSRRLTTPSWSPRAFPYSGASAYAGCRTSRSRRGSAPAGPVPPTPPPPPRPSA